MKSGCYLALLRGINVGGRHIIKMADLKACFQEIGCTDVTTFIQSGNVIFRNQERDVATLMRQIERTLSARFAYASRVVVLTHARLARVVQRAPAGFGSKPGQYRYDVIFLRAPLTTAEAMKCVSLREGVDTVHKGTGVLYFSRLISKAAQSHLAKIVSLPVYRHMTIRNWNTTTRLFAMMEEEMTR
jgi:uncharacterized protein (DUF1697 family)